MISIIVPTFNEGEGIEKLLSVLKEHNYGLVTEVIVVDASYCSKTRKAAKRYNVLYINAKKGRACQMNAGAEKAKGSILYFLHADSFPPKYFDRHIITAIEGGEKAGCFTMKFDSSHPVLRVSGWFTQFHNDWCRGGDQSLFIDKELFYQIGKFDESLIIMEDNEIIPRIKKETDFSVIPQKLVTSARRYNENGVVRLQLLFGLIHLGYRVGVPQRQLVSFYKRHIN